MANGKKHYHHGRTPAAWTGSIVAAIGFLVAALAFFFGPDWTIFWVGTAIVGVGVVAGGAMRVLGLGQG